MEPYSAHLLPKQTITHVKVPIYHVAQNKTTLKRLSKPKDFSEENAANY